MQINFRRVGTVIFASIVGLVLLSFCPPAEGQSKDHPSKPTVVLSKLVPPAYPFVARQARVFGEVHLRVSVHSDGSINSVIPIDGPPLLVRAALDSARQSQFECEDCAVSDVTRSFTYSFQFPPEGEKSPDPCCCSHKPRSSDCKPPSTHVSQSDDRITVTAPIGCICDATSAGGTS